MPGPPQDASGSGRFPFPPCTSGKPAPPPPSWGCGRFPGQAAPAAPTGPGDSHGGSLQGHRVPFGGIDPHRGDTQASVFLFKVPVELIQPVQQGILLLPGLLGRGLEVIGFGNGGNILSNQSVEFNRGKAKNNNLAKITFGKNLENEVKYNNTSIQNINESEIAEKNFSESLEEDEEKFDIKIKDENEINYDDMLNKNDDLKFLDFDNFLDISKINKNKNDIDDLCAIRYTKEEEQQQNQKVNEALKDAKDSSNEEELIKKNEEETKIQDIVNFSGENTLGLKYNERNIKDIENNNQNIDEEKNNNENNLKQDFNEEKEHDIEDKISSGEKSLINEEDEVNTNFKNSNKQINDDENEDDIPNE